jgi:hypothetical protein
MVKPGPYSQPEFGSVDPLAPCITVIIQGNLRTSLCPDEARRIAANGFTITTTLRGAGTFGADFSLGPPSADRFTTETAGGKSR